MQRDVKIGLALGLLLVVLVAALFFRREPDSTADVPRLSDPESLNQALGERERSPYPVSDQDEFTSPPAPPPASRAETRRDDPARPRVPGLLASDDERLHNRLLTGSRSSVPDPIPSNRQDVPPSLTASEADDAPAGNGLRTHTIKAGDRLSVLASRYLGSAARFDEIYKANQGVLKNPNQLPVGVTIVIPPRTPPRPLTAAEPPPESTKSSPDQPLPDGPLTESQSSQPVAAAETPVDAPAPAARKSLFSPSRRGPFSSGRIGLPRAPVRTPLVDAEPQPRPEASPPAETRPALPQIDVNDLLEEETIRRRD